MSSIAKKAAWNISRCFTLVHGYWRETHSMQWLWMVFLLLYYYAIVTIAFGKHFKYYDMNIILYTFSYIILIFKQVLIWTYMNRSSLFIYIQYTSSSWYLYNIYLYWQYKNATAASCSRDWRSSQTFDEAHFRETCNQGNQHLQVVNGCSSEMLLNCMNWDHKWIVLGYEESCN